MDKTNQFWDKHVTVVCTHCRDVLKITDPKPVFTYRVDARADVQTALKYWKCPNCGKSKLELVQG